MEAYAFTLLSSGLIVAALAWIWLLVRVFQQNTWWGIVCLILPPLGLVFALRHSQRAIAPLICFVLGSTISAAPMLYSLVGPVDLGLRQQLHQEPTILSLGKSFLESDSVHEWMESRAFYMQLGGVAIAVLAWVWLLVRAFRQNHKWGLSSLIIPPVGLIFAGCHPRKAVLPLTLVLVCLLVAATPAIYTLTVPPDSRARERIVDGEKHLTLTGADSKAKDAPDLTLKQDVSVL